MRFSQEISIFNPFAINRAVISLGTSITQTAQEIRLEAQRTYTTQDQTRAWISVKADEITSMVEDNYPNNVKFQSAISQTPHSIELSVSNSGVINKQGSASAGITITMKDKNGNVIDSSDQANIYINGSVVFTGDLGASGTTKIDGGRIATGEISLDRISGNSGTLTIQSDRLKINSGTIGLGNAIAANRWTIGGDSTRAWIYSGSKNNTKTNTAGIYIGTNGIEVKETTGSTGNVTRIDGDGIFTTYINMYDSGANASTWMYFDDSNDYASGYHRMLFPRGIATGIYGEGAANNLFRNYTRCEGGLWVPDGAVDGSDRRLKKSITKIDRRTAMDFIKSLQPSSFKYKNGNDDFYHHGFIAQEAREKAWDGLVVEGKEDGMLGIRYHEIIADIVAVLQDLLAERE